MSTVRPAIDHMHDVNWRTGLPRFHFDATSDAAAAAAAAAAASAAKPWHDGVEAETLGFWQNKGYDVTSPLKVAAELTKQYRAAEKHLGVPADQIVKMPKADAPPEDLRAFYERLGAPKEAKDYDLTAVKDPAIAESLRATMHERGVPKDAAASIAATVAKALDSKVTTENGELTAKLAEQKANLQKNWGDKFGFNHLQAIEGARRLGISPEGVKALEGQIGYDQVMEAMRKIGANTREDTFIEKPPGGPQGDVTTLEGAKSRKQELMADNAWVTRYNAGGQVERREMDRLNQMISGYVP